jgi:hypothetical protein
METFNEKSDAQLADEIVTWSGRSRRAKHT